MNSEVNGLGVRPTPGKNTEKKNKKHKGKQNKKQKNSTKSKIILAKCPNTVWVLHREKVVLGVVLSCYVVLGSRVVSSPIVLCYVVLSPVVLCCIEVYGVVSSIEVS